MAKEIKTLTLAKIYEPLLKKKRIKALFGGRGGGRGNPVDMVIRTAKGFMRFGDLVIGDKVIGSDGKYTDVTAIYERGILPTYRVKFSDGSYLDTDPTHLWAFDYTRASEGISKRRVITTQDILEMKPKDYYRWHLPLTAIKEGVHVNVNMYLVGLWLADGSWSCGRSVISKKEPGVVKYLKSQTKQYWTRHDGVNNFRFRADSIFSRFLEAHIGHKTAYNKFIPDICLLAPYEQRLELLRGLMDGDGRLSKHPGRDYNNAQYHTMSTALADGIVSLVCSLGGTSRKVKDTDGTWEVKVNVPFNPFKHTHEAKEYKKCATSNYGQRILAGIEYIGDKQIRCIKVSNNDHLYVADKNFSVLTHNSHNVARYLLGRSLNEKIRIWCAREIQNSISDSVQHLFVELIEEYGLQQYFKITDQDIVSCTGSYFMFKGFRGSGGTYSAERLKAYEDFDVLWVEEASACSMESLNVVSKTIRKEGSELIFTFNRVLEEDPVWRFTCYDCGDIYNTGYFEDNDRLIIYANVEKNEFATSILYKEQEQDKKRLTIDEYNRIWLGYPDRSGGMKAFFSRDLIYNNNSKPSYEESQCWEVVCGFDPNGGGKDSACAVARQGREILAIEVIRGVKDPLELAQLFIAFKRKFGAKRAYCDRGYGQGVIAIARQEGESIIPVDFGGRAVTNENCINRRAEIYYKLREWLQEGGYLGDPKENEIVELKRELQAVEYNLRKSDDGKIALGPKDDMRKKLGHSPDRADAVALTFAGNKDRMIRDKRGLSLESSEDFAQEGDYAVQKFDNIDTTGLI